MVSVISKLKYEVLDDLELIRGHLEANPPKKDQGWVAAEPKRSDRGRLRVGDHPPPVVGSKTGSADLPIAARTQADRAIPDADPSLTRFKALLAVLDQVFRLDPETAATVADLSRLTKEAVRIADELGTAHKFDSIQLPAPDGSGLRGVKRFGEIRSAIVIASKYFERLSFYSTSEGKDYLRGVIGAKLTEAEEGGLVNIKDHHYGERIDPLAAMRSDFNYGHYLKWAEGKYGSGSDPVDHMVEYVMKLSSPNFSDGGPNPARLGTSEDLTPFIMVRIRSSVPGDEKFSRGELSRMWTYQVKVAEDSSRYEPWVPGSKWTEGVGETCDWYSNAPGRRIREFR